MSSTHEPRTGRACAECNAPIAGGRLCEGCLAEMLGEAPTNGGGPR